MQKIDAHELENIERSLLLEGIFQCYGFDFRDYAPASLKRRVEYMMAAEGLTSISALQDQLLHDPVCMLRFLDNLSINVTAMFRDPSLFSTIRKKVIPLLNDYPFIRIWHAGCSTGEEVYSMAILLEEEGLYNRCCLYGTDMSATVIATAKEGIFPLAAMQGYTENYLQAGGKQAFSEYYTARYNNAIFRTSLNRNIVFAEHNLVSDGSFNEFHLILCRNVMIYFNKKLQGRVHKLLYESLTVGGILGLGEKESLHFTPFEHCYDELDRRSTLFRKKRS